jgi:hypothetical protein
VALQYLRVQEYRFRVTDHTAVTEACSASDYILLLKSFLPSLLRFSDVVICLFANDFDTDVCSDDCDHDVVDDDDLISPDESCLSFLRGKGYHRGACLFD